MTKTEYGYYGKCAERFFNFELFQEFEERMSMLSGDLSNYERERIAYTEIETKYSTGKYISKGEDGKILLASIIKMGLHFENKNYSSVYEYKMDLINKYKNLKQKENYLISFK